MRNVWRRCNPFGMSPVPLGHFIRKRQGSLACNTLCFARHLGAPPVVTCETVWGCAIAFVHLHTFHYLCTSTRFTTFAPKVHRVSCIVHCARLPFQIEDLMANDIGVPFNSKRAACEGRFNFTVISSFSRDFKCPQSDLNRHTVKRQFLKLVCLPFHHKGFFKICITILSLYINNR